LKSDDAAIESLRHAACGAARQGAHTNETLALAVLRLRERNPEASALFASVAHRYDVRDAWLGAAVACHLQGENSEARFALVQALSRYAHRSIPRILGDIAATAGAYGWAVLYSSGRIAIRLVRQVSGARTPAVSLDGRPLKLRAEASQSYAALLPADWRRGTELRISAEHGEILGGAIQLKEIARVEGFVDTHHGNLQGWVWSPHDPDHLPVLSICAAAGGTAISVTPADQAADVRIDTPLARPRAFEIPAYRLRSFDGPVRVCGENGQELRGSPLDPSMERRSAEAAATVVANLFPAPGHERGPVPAPVMLAAPARVSGRPATGSHRKREVEVVIPVYGALDFTLACLESVLADLPRWARVHVVDDASPDPAVGEALRCLADEGRITLNTNQANLGFPASANVGLRHDPERDAVLLNSDTLVPPGWLESLREAAYAAPSVGTATPLSNDATILSYPSTEHENAIPDLDETVRLNALCHAANAGRLVDIPSAVGFCVYIRRDCLNATGMLREDIFAQGYGEENDFCIRARHLGWRHVAAPGVFVAHVGGRSFGDAKRHLIERNMRRVNQLHPGYDELIAEFLRTDPLAEARRRIDVARWKQFRSAARSVLLVTHGRDGGVKRHVAERAAALRRDALRPIVLWPVASRGGKGRDCVLGNGPQGGTPNLRFSLPAELGTLAELLEGDSPLRAEVHSMIGHDARLIELFDRLRIPYELVVHDYSWICPRINLVGRGDRYCGEPDAAGCDACVADLGTRIEETISAAELRKRSARTVRKASRIVAPSADVARRLRRYFPRLRAEVAGWEDEDHLPAPQPPAPSGVRRVCVIGAIGVEKGYEVLLSCARDAARRGLALEFVLVGKSCDDDRLTATGRVRITGKYEPHEAVALIARQQAALAWLPSIWPETWCYTLTEAWQAGLDVLAFDIGAPAERIRRTGRGWVCPLGISAAALNDRMLALRSPAVAAVVGEAA
jgi:GT2 family glycosyltransferase